MKTKLFLSVLFFLAFAGIAQAQEQLPDTVWTKNLWPDEIVKVKFTPDGTKIITVCKDKIIVYDALSGAELKNIDFYQYSFGSHAADIAFSPDSSQFVIPARNGKIIIFNSFTFDTIKTYKINWDISSLTYNSNGDKLFIVRVEFSFDHQKNLLIYDLLNGNIINQIGDEGTIQKITFSFEKNIFATYSITESGNIQKHYIKLWNADSLKEIATLGTHEDIVTDLEFSKDGKFVATASMDNLVKIWDVDDINLLREINLEHNIYNICFFPDHSNILIGDGGSYSNSYIWDIEDNDSIYTYHYSSFTDSDISNIKQLIIASTSRNLYILNIKSNETGIPGLVNNQSIIYPNPNNGMANIAIKLDTAQNIKIEITDNLGKIIKILKNEQMGQGIQNIKWDTSNISSGEYFCIITGTNINQTMKIIVNK